MKLKKTYPLIENSNPWICVASKLTFSLRIINGIYRSHLKKHGVTMSQLSLLMATAKMKSVSQAQLGKTLKLERSTVTRDLKRLIAKGYLIKEGPTNRPIISITDKGATYTEEIIPDWYNATQEARKILGEDGEEGLNLVLEKLTK